MINWWYKRCVIWLKTAYYFIMSINCYRNATLLSSEKTIEKIVDSKKSLIRFGDGELLCMKGKSISYQEHNLNLSRELKSIEQTYLREKVDCNFILCMPNEFLKCNGMTLLKRRKWISSWSFFRYYFKHNLDGSIEYGDSFMFSKRYKKIYQEIWKKKDNIIFVHNKKIYADEFEKSTGKKVIFISIPERNAYACIDNIVNNIKNAIKNLKDLEKSLILISAGPCAKAVVFRLINEEIQIIDTGHCWDDPLELRK